MKNIVFCCDGTGGKYSSNLTNVVKTVRLCTKDDSQIVSYHQGVGIVNILGKPRYFSFIEVLGLLFGYGSINIILDGYKFIMNEYEEGDKIFLFGFSRGAFIVRILADLICQCGLLPPGSTNIFSDLVATYFTKIPNFAARAKFKETFSRTCYPYFIGVWDTVASLGYLYGKKFHNDVLHEGVPIAYQALAIDEHRSKFKPSIWEPESNITQLWFAGCHCDVGGWYKETGLSDIALEWMLDNAEKEGLQLVPNWKELLRPNIQQPVHISREGFWKIIPNYNRVLPVNAQLHPSVIEKLQLDPTYRPQNINSCLLP